ncbi:MAG: molybdopterin molybdotransferase MoeA [Thermomonas sp.]
MIGIEDAIARVRAAARPVPVERLSLADARGRVLAQDVVAAMSLPPFDNSAMDGFALRAGDSSIAAGSEFVVEGEQAAGDAARAARGEACEIMTGARMPDGFDSVVPVEDVVVLERDALQRPVRIRIERDVAPGQHLRRAGEDMRAGALALQAGIVLDPFACMLLDALGAVEIAVRRRPRIAVFATGRELVADPRRALASGEIRDSNGPYLEARLIEAGAEVLRRATLPDDAQTFVAAVREVLALGVDAVISTGAVSMGRYDFVPEALAMLGAETQFHKLRMRPGKPQLFAMLPRGALFFGLPGNPISTAVGQRLLVETALRRMLGMADETRWRLPLAEDARKKPGNASIQKAALRIHADGGVRVQPLRGQESFRIAPLREANVWMLLPEEGERVAAGTLVDVLPPSHMQATLLGSAEA